MGGDEAGLFLDWPAGVLAVYHGVLEDDDSIVEWCVE